MQDYGGYGGEARYGIEASDGGETGYGGQPGDGSQPGYGGQPSYGGYGGQPDYLGWGPPPPPPRGPGLLRYLVVAVVAAALGAGAVVGIGHLGSSSTPAAGSAPASGGSSAPALQPQQPQQSGPAQIPAGGTAPKGVLTKVSAGLVIINTALQYRAEQAAGTGMVINSDGLVLTNNHVIENATSISGTVVATGKTYRARVLGYDQTGDIAAIQLAGASGLPAIPVGNSSTLKVGQQVIALGNAGGGSQIVPASGTVTALNQTITAQDENGVQTSETLHGMIQTDAGIVAGDSGGALATTSGQVIGMNTAGNSVQFSQQQAAGFAIPISTALSVVNQIAAGHATSTITIGYPPFIGIFIATSTNSNPQAQAADQQQNGNSGFGPQQSCYTSDASLPVPSTIAPASRGTLLIGTICGSPAAAAGLTGGDVITAVNGTPVGAPPQLHTLLSKFGPGDSVQLTYINLSGQQKTTTLRLAAGPPQ
jgi:S1-C subfamily serine protease